MQLTAFFIAVHTSTVLIQCHVAQYLHVVWGHGALPPPLNPPLVAVSFKIIVTTSVTRPCFTTQHQTCRPRTRPRPISSVWYRSSPKTYGLRPHHWLRHTNRSHVGHVELCHAICYSNVPTCVRPCVRVCEKNYSDQQNFPVFYSIVPDTSNDGNASHAFWWLSTLGAS